MWSVSADSDPSNAVEEGQGKQKIALERDQGFSHKTWAMTLRALFARTTGLWWDASERAEVRAVRSKCTLHEQARSTRPVCTRKPTLS